jgi:hypothetical protein
MKIAVFYAVTPSTLVDRYQRTLEAFVTIYEAARHNIPEDSYIYNTNKQTNKLHGLSPRANYTDRATAACRQSNCQLLRLRGAT